MAQLGNVPEIIQVKRKMESLKERGLIKEWEIPYENILTRLTAAIFFLTPAKASYLEEIWQEFADHERLQYRQNEEKKLSTLDWRVEFNKGFMLS
jgi:hypothetical protein